MSEVQTYPCPKCGFPSRDPEICDSCGIIYARYGQRDFGFEQNAAPAGPAASPEMEEVEARPPLNVFRIAVTVGVALVVIVGAWFLMRPASQRTAVGLAHQHRVVITHARRELVSGQTPDEQKALVRRLHDMTANLAVQISELPRAKNDEDEERLAALSEANNLLIAALEVPTEDLVKKLSSQGQEDPFVPAEEKLSVLIPTMTSEPTDDTTTSSPSAQAQPPAGGEQSASTGILTRLHARAARMIRGSPASEPVSLARHEPTRQEMIDLARIQARQFAPLQPPPTQSPQPSTRVEASQPEFLVLTQASFDGEVIRSRDPTLVYFWAAWCGPCKAVSPILHPLSQSYQGKIKFASVNLEQNSQLGSRFSISSLPAFLVFKDGKVRKRIVGVPTREQLIQALNDEL